MPELDAVKQIGDDRDRYVRYSRASRTAYGFFGWGAAALAAASAGLEKFTPAAITPDTKQWATFWVAIAAAGFAVFNTVMNYGQSADRYQKAVLIIQTALVEFEAGTITLRQLTTEYRRAQDIVAGGIGQTTSGATESIPTRTQSTPAESGARAEPASEAKKVDTAGHQ